MPGSRVRVPPLLFPKPFRDFIPLTVMPRQLALSALAAVLLASPVPAQSVAGEWNATYDTPGGPRSFTVVLEVSGDSLTGVVKRPAGESPLSGRIAGDSVHFSYLITYGDNTLTIGISARVTGDAMSGVARFGFQAEAAFSARRAKRPESSGRFWPFGCSGTL